MNIQTFVKRARTCRTPQELFGLLTEVGSSTGLHLVAYIALKDHDRYGQPVYPPPLIMTNFPPVWVSSYFARRYQTIDPILIHSMDMAVPYLWRWLPRVKDLSREQLDILDETEKAGIHHGMTIPLNGPRETAALVSFAGTSAAATPEPHMGRLGLFAAIFHITFVEMVGAARQKMTVQPLTAREQDCLRWIARGKTSYEISIILGISEHTVRSYTKNIFRKLNMNNRTMAVARAMQLGLIRDE